MSKYLKHLLIFFSLSLSSLSFSLFLKFLFVCTWISFVVTLNSIFFPLLLLLPSTSSLLRLRCHCCVRWWWFGFISALRMPFTFSLVANMLDKWFLADWIEIGGALCAVSVCVFPAILIASKSDFCRFNEFQPNIHVYLDVMWFALLFFASSSSSSFFFRLWKLTRGIFNGNSIRFLLLLSLLSCCCFCRRRRRHNIDFYRVKELFVNLDVISLFILFISLHQIKFYFLAAFAHKVFSLDIFFSLSSNFYCESLLF